MKLTNTVIAIVVAGCTSRPSSQPLPGATVEPLPMPSNAAAMSGARPCGYDYSFVAAVATPTGIAMVPGHDRARIMYNPIGLDVLESAVDATGAFAFQHGFEYDLMGNLVQKTTTRAGAAGLVQHDWLVYDSFGRLIRHSIDDNGNDREDWKATYGYAGSNHPTIEQVRPIEVAVASYDLTYHYDDGDRVVEVDRDDGPDGVSDEIDRYAYDEIQRVTTMVATDHAGVILRRSTTSYDEQNRVQMIVTAELDAQGITTSIVSDMFGYDADRLVLETHDDSASPGSAVRTAWQYDHCQ